MVSDSRSRNDQPATLDLSQNSASVTRTLAPIIVVREQGRLDLRERAAPRRALVLASLLVAAEAATLLCHPA
jgi:hypothetical protein